MTNTVFKTERAQILCESGKYSLVEEICMAASDYRCAYYKKPLFAKEYGGLDAFRENLFTFVREWEASS